ncbi:MAG TPA: hypothetical protein VJ302_32245 [Blastocatellia bacterium]|nr:hypothetical protein [Blastocatellia bacterium]
MTKKLFFPVMTLVIALSLVGLTWAQTAQGAKTTVTGYLVDKHCATKDVATHSKGCSVSGSCAKSGLGVYADGKWTAFDAAGSKLAIDALNKSPKDSGAKFKVVGTLKEDILTDVQITEITE